MKDAINHPEHYTQHPSGVECITITEHLTFNIGNVFKYLWRSGLKDGEPTLKDLKKAQWYLNREIFKVEQQEEERAAIVPNKPTPAPRMTRGIPQA